MKKILLLGAGILTIPSFSQINVPQVQKSLYSSVDATWCGNCGKDGIPSTAAIYDNVEDKAVFFELHASTSSALFSSTAKALADEFGVDSYPRATVNGIDKGSLNSTLITPLTTEITTNYNSSETMVNAGFEWKTENDSIIVDVKTTFFEDANGEYYTGVYITEDSIWEYQANYDPAIPNGNIYHFHILRDVLSTNIHGKITGTGTINANDEITSQHSIKIDPEWALNNIHINTVVWKKTGSDYEFVNANNTGTALTTNLSIHSVNDFESIGISPNPSSNIIQISELNDQITQLDIMDNLGRIVKTTPANSHIDISFLDKGQYQLIGRNSKSILARSKFIIQ